MFSAAAEAVIALEGQQAGCNDIINLLTTTEELELFLWRLSRPSICFQVTVCGACSVFQSCLPRLMHVFCVYKSNIKIKQQDAVKYMGGQNVWPEIIKEKKKMCPNNLLVSPGGSIKPFFDILLLPPIWDQGTENRAPKLQANPSTSLDSLAKAIVVPFSVQST